MRITIGILFSFVALGFTQLNAQLQVQNGTSAQQMVQSITGENVQILNPVITASDGAWGTFQSNVGNFQAQDGVLLATGLITNALGPNNTQGKSTAFVGNNGDPKLTFVSGYATRDACKLEFDIIPAGDSLRFKFTFASEEYDEYACTNFNDVFGFFISGPGITGDPGLPGFHNIALLPGTTSPVTINSVNHGNPNQGGACPAVNPQYHVQNPLSPIAAIQYDGWTKNLIAIANNLIPCETYHLELIIADASDRLWDSGVFIEKIESNNVRVDVITDGENPMMYEGCNNGTVSFCIETPLAEDFEVSYFLHGSAVNGTDYALIGDPSPAFEHTITIPAGALCAYLPINTIDDGIDEGTEYVDIIVVNPLCGENILDSIRALLRDSLELYITGNTQICIGENISLGLDSGGTSFQWTPTSLNFTPSSTWTNVMFTPTDDVLVTLTSTIAMCTATDQVLIQVSEMDLDFAISLVPCQNVCNGAIDMTINDGIPPFTINWNSGAFNTEDLEGLCEGTYTVRVTDGIGCVVEASVQLGLAPPIQIIISPLVYAGGYNISCNGASDGAIEITIVGGQAPYSISYSAGPNSLPVGPVTVSVVDAIGCTGETTYTMLEPDPLGLIITNLNPVLCAGAETGSMTVSGTGGSGVYPSYIWYLNGTLVNSGATYNNAPGGTYTIEVEDENNCMASMDVVLPEPSEELDGIVVSQTNVACNGENTGSVTVNGIGGTIAVGSDYDYLWSDNSSISPVRTNLLAGTYNCTLTDDNNCSTLLTVIISQPSLLLVNILVENDIACEGQSCGNALAVGSGGAPGTYTYEWEAVPVGSNPNFPQFSPAATFCEPGFYTITVTDQNNCKVEEQIEITIESTEITATFDITDVLCAGDSTGQIDATIVGGIPPYTFNWVGGNCAQGPIITEDLTNVCAGLWCLTLTDSNGCELDTCLTIQEPPALNYFFTMEPSLCADNCSGSIDFVPTGGTPPYNYAWFGPVIPGSGDMFDLTDTLSTSEDLTNLCKGQYLIFLYDSLGCSFERTITVTAPEDLLILTDSISDFNGYQVSCPDACDGWIYVTATGGSTTPTGNYLYTWLEQGIFGAGTPFQQGMGSGFDDLTDLCASEDTVGYELILVDDNQCIQNAFFIMEEPDEIEFDFDVTNVSCSGFTDGSVTVTLSGGVPPYDITWTDSTAAVIGIGFTITGIGEGLYYASVIDLNGCMGMDSVLVGTPNPISAPLDFISYNGFGVPCFGDCEGTIFSGVTGGTMPYTYAWSADDCLNPSFSNVDAVLNGLCIGTYAMTVTDSQGCFVCETITLDQPDTLVSNAIVMDISCEGLMDGSIDLGLSGGVGPYTTDWTVLPDGNEIQTGLGDGEYAVVVTDQNDCSFFAEFEIEEPTDLIAVATSPLMAGGFNVSCNGVCDGTINLSVSGGAGGYTILWTGPAPVGGGDGTSYVGVACEGIYEATVTDANGCVVVAAITLTEAPPISFVFNVLVPISCNGDCDGQLSAGAQGGVGQFTYVWDDPAMTAGPVTPANLCEGFYCVTATSGNGCVAVGCFSLTDPEVLSMNCAVQNLDCAGAGNGSITCTTIGGTFPFDYEWTGPTGFTSDQESIFNLEPGTYCVDLVDSHGCAYSECFDITQPAPIEVQVLVSDFNDFGVSCNGVCDGSIDITASGGFAPYSYSPAQNLEDLCPGLVNVIVTDATGCEFTQDVEITEPAPMSVSLTSPLYDCGTNVNCSGGNTGTIFSTVLGGTAPDLTYYWIEVSTGDTLLSGSGIPDIDDLFAGEYQLVAVDLNGCSGSASITLDEPATAFTVSATLIQFPSGDNVSCFGACDGEIMYSADGNCGDPVYSWFDSESNPLTSTVNLCAGLYTLVSIDGAECTYTLDVTLIEPAEILLNPIVTTTACFNVDTASIVLDITGGSAPFMISWDSDLPTQPSQDNLSPGTYIVMIIDVNGCESEQEFEITEPDTLLVTLFSPILAYPDFNVSEFMGTNGSVDAEVTGGTPSYTFVWTGEGDFNSFSQDISGLLAGEYCLIVTDSLGCIWDQCITLSEPFVLALPNGMSPNGDGQNDGLYIQGLEGFSNNNVQVFNRWGNQVFEQSNYRNSNLWKGEGKNGNLLPDGTYFVLLQVNGGERELSGYLEIRR